VYIYIIIKRVETSIYDHSRSRECVRTVMCWTARRWEYISIAAIAVSNLPVSPLPITRLSRQAQATADTEPHSASTPPRDEPSSLVAIDDDSSINSWYSDSTHTQTLILLHTQPPLPHGTSPPASLPLTTTAPSTADTATLHTDRQTHTQTLILLHTQPPLPRG